MADRVYPTSQTNTATADISEYESEIAKKSRQEHIRDISEQDKPKDAKQEELSDLCLIPHEQHP
jgi:hypothetical protein